MKRALSWGAIASALFATTISFGGMTTMAWADDPVPIQIGAASNVLFTPVFVLADESNGIAAKHGLKVQSRMFNSGIATMEAAMAGEIDVAFPNTRVLLPLLSSGKACFKGGIMFADGDIVRMVTTSGINKPEDLIGKKIGTRKAGVGEVALHIWLDSKGIPRDKVEIVNLAEEDQPIALAQGKIDGLIWVEPTPSIALQIMGDKAHRFGDIGAAFRNTGPVNVSCRWVEKNGDKAMTGFIGAWVDTIKWIQANQDAAAELTAKNLQLTPEEVKKFWATGDILNGWPIELTDSQIQMFVNYGDYIKSTDPTFTMPDMSKWIDSKWLKEVDPSLVKLEKFKY